MEASTFSHVTCFIVNLAAAASWDGQSIREASVETKQLVDNGSDVDVWTMKRPKI